MWSRLRQCLRICTQLAHTSAVRGHTRSLELAHWHWHAGAWGRSLVPFWDTCIWVMLDVLVARSCECCRVGLSPCDCRCGCELCGMTPVCSSGLPHAILEQTLVSCHTAGMHTCMGVVSGGDVFGLCSCGAVPATGLPCGLRMRVCLPAVSYSASSTEACAARHSWHTHLHWDRCISTTTPCQCVWLAWYWDRCISTTTPCQCVWLAWYWLASCHVGCGPQGPCGTSSEGL
jgi:hypothetical protein